MLHTLEITLAIVNEIIIIVVIIIIIEFQKPLFFILRFTKLNRKRLHIFMYIFLPLNLTIIEIYRLTSPCDFFLFICFLNMCIDSSEISPTRCNNCVFILRNGFTLHVSGDNLTHHQEYICCI